MRSGGRGKMRKFVAIFAAVVLFPVCAIPSAGQSGTASQSTASQSAVSPQKPATKPPQAVSKIVVRTTDVLVPVTVKDPSGNLVADLQQDDFRIFQDNVEQPIRFFWNEPFPISAVVILDDDLPTKESEKVQKSLDSIAAGFGPNDEVALVRFDEYPKLVMDFSANNDALFAQLKQIRTNQKDALDSRVPGTPPMVMTTPPRINGQTLGGAADIPVLGTNTNGVTKHVDDAIHYAAEMLRNRARDRRKIIFLVSDGTNDRHNQWSFNNTLRLLLANNVSVYAIAVNSSADILKLQGPGRLAQYANSTGGDVFSATKQMDLERMYAALTEEARNQYTLAFEPSKTVGKGNYHTIEVRVERPGLAVTARQGYYASFPR